jgi:hypothetical protein
VARAAADLLLPLAVTGGTLDGGRLLIGRRLLLLTSSSPSFASMVAAAGSIAPAIFPSML